jgi:hypothetical protein
MKTTLSIAALLIAGTIRASAQDAPPPPPMDDSMMKLIEATSPNANHKKLEMFLGNWDVTSSFWVGGPEKPPVSDKGSAKIAWALGGRFLRQEFKGAFMGMPMDGIGFNGYDNVKKAYTMFWIDNTSTAMGTGAGQFDASGTVLTMTGKMDDPMTGRMGLNVKHVLRKTEMDRFVYELYEVPATGPEIKMGEVVYTKASEHN